MVLKPNRITLLYLFEKLLTQTQTKNY